MKSTIVMVMAILVVTVAPVSSFGQTRPAATRPTPQRPAAPQVATPTTTTQSATIAMPANVPVSKIAIVDTTMFGDETNGIKRYSNTVSSVRREFEGKRAELTNLQSQIQALTDSLTKPGPGDGPSLSAKQADIQRLTRDLKYKSDQAQADFDKRYAEVVGPVSNDIGNALIQYTARNGLTMIIDISKLEAAVLSINPAMDVTRAFIADYNGTHP
jgi:Skp family chaperone for outer membrane proteins